jgi:nucleotide-binding universal stress UspA family protein
MFEKILVAHDGSEGAERAFEAALELATRLRLAHLHMISVEEDLPRHAETMGEIEEEKEFEDTYFGQLIAQSKRRASFRGVQLECEVIPGNEIKTIVEYAGSGNFDLLIVGYTGHSAIYDHLWGGTSQNLTRMAPCSVLVVK